MRDERATMTIFCTSILQQIQRFMNRFFRHNRRLEDWWTSRKLDIQNSAPLMACSWFNLYSIKAGSVDVANDLGRHKRLTWKIPGVDATRANGYEKTAFLLVNIVLCYGYGYVQRSFADETGRRSTVFHFIDEVRICHSS